MQDASKPIVIALEEHYTDPEVTRHYTTARPPHIVKKLEDLGAQRLKEMDEAGVDMQVLSHGAPALQRFDKDLAVGLAPKVNDRLHAVVQANPKRLQAFAALPTAEPNAAADELERCVNRLGFKGAMLHGLSHDDRFMDDKRFWPIYERAQALDVPVYMHPAAPHKAVVEAYYKDYVAEYPQVVAAGWGYTVETATQGVRMVLSGVFDAYPRLKIILGHLGEGLPFSLWRIDAALSRPGNKGGSFRKIFSDHFYVTTSGNFSDPALLCTLMELGADRILFSIDWPFVDNKPGVDWAKRLPLSEEDRIKILGGNAKRVLKL
jgi:predicted TIM-barrel fold metal-dependent hydrolase